MNIRHKLLNIRHLIPVAQKKRVAGSGFALPLVIIVMIILIMLSAGAMMAGYGSRLQAVKAKAETEAMLAAEAGYEQAIFWMSQQSDILGAIQSGGGSGNINFSTSRCSYEISFQDFIGARPVFKILSTGISGRPTFTRIVDVSVMQETSGWAMGACRVPTGPTSTTGVHFADDEIIDMPLHINNAHDSPDERDMFITGTPQFLRKVEMGEPRKTSGGYDKYSGVMTLFDDGIYFDQPNVRITDEAAVLSKINRFRDSTDAAYRFNPVGTASFSKYNAVQLEFFVEGGIGKVRITNNCSVKRKTAGTYDYKVEPGSGGNRFEIYDIYDYHTKPTSEASIPVPIENTYVTQEFAGYESEPGGQIYVDGSVVIGGESNIQTVKGKITVVATGNIWVADSIKMDGAHDTSPDRPSADNTNVLGLIAQGVIKVVNPTSSSSPYTPSGQIYQPIGITKPYPYNSGRYLPDPTVVEAAITVGGGGWGAEYVGVYDPYSHNYLRREYTSPQDDLIVCGSITEVIRGAVGIVGSDGYLKNYYIDPRLMSGILPGDIWFSGKYIPAPAGWHDHSINN